MTSSSFLLPGFLCSVNGPDTVVNQREGQKQYYTYTRFLSLSMTDGRVDGASFIYKQKRIDSS